MKRIIQYTIPTAAASWLSDKLNMPLQANLRRSNEISRITKNFRITTFIVMMFNFRVFVYTYDIFV